MQAANPSSAEAPELRLVQAFSDRMTTGALPGEIDGFGAAEQAAAADFVARAAAVRRNGEPDRKSVV